MKARLRQQWLSVRDSRLLRRAAPFLLVLWFIAMNYLYLGPWLLALDARIYQRAANLFAAGMDPWAAEHAGYYFAAAPPSLLPYLPLSFLPESIAVVFWMLAGLAAAVYIIRTLKLAWWWIFFPPLAEAVVVGNPQPIALGLLLASRTPLTALASLFKLYALLPAIGRPRDLIVSICVLALTSFVLPWGEFLSALPTITQRLEEQSLGGYSAYENHFYLPVLLAALVILRKHGWRWFAIPALWPATQMHYSLYAMPAMTPLLAIGFAVPIRGVPPLIVVTYAIVMFMRNDRPTLVNAIRHLSSRRWASGLRRREDRVVAESEPGASIGPLVRAARLGSVTGCTPDGDHAASRHKG